MTTLSTSQPHAIINAQFGLTVETYSSKIELAEAAAYRVWQEIGGPEDHIKWLRGLADKFEQGWIDEGAITKGSNVK